MQRQPMGNISLAILVIGFFYVVWHLFDVARNFPRRADLPALLLDLAILALCFTIAWVVRRLP